MVLRQGDLMFNVGMHLHLVQRFEVHAAHPAAVPDREGGIHFVLADGGMLLLQVHLLVLDKVATVVALPPGRVLVDLPVIAQFFGALTLHATLDAGVAVLLFEGGIFDGCRDRIVRLKTGE